MKLGITLGNIETKGIKLENVEIEGVFEIKEAMQIVKDTVDYLPELIEKLYKTYDLANKYLKYNILQKRKIDISKELEKLNKIRNEMLERNDKKC